MEPENDAFQKTLYRFQGSHLQVKHLQVGSLEFSLKNYGGFSWGPTPRKVNLHDNFLSVCSFKGLTPRKINIEPENVGLVQRIFLFQGSIFRFHVNLPGCIRSSPSKEKTIA